MQKKREDDEKKAIADDEATQASADNDDDGGSDDDDGAADEDEDGEDDDDASWEPARRIRNASRKLQGYNPIDIMLDDLQQNRFVSTNDSSPRPRRDPSRPGGAWKWRRGRRWTQRESPGGAAAPAGAVHSEGPQEPILEVADQVSRLIDIATDPNVIGRQWQGCPCGFRGRAKMHPKERKFGARLRL